MQCVSCTLDSLSFLIIQMGECNYSVRQDNVRVLTIISVLLHYNILDGYPASLGFRIMHRVHVICIGLYPCHNCQDIK